MVDIVAAHKYEARALRVCVAGSRNFMSLEKVDLIVSTLPDGTVVVHGGARGVDQRAGEAAQDRGLSVEIFRPDWETHGRSAGPIRNKEMVRTCDYLVAFWDGKSRGTASSIQAAIDNGVDFEVILDD